MENIIELINDEDYNTALLLLYTISDKVEIGKIFVKQINESLKKLQFQVESKNYINNYEIQNKINMYRNILNKLKNLI